MNEKEISIFISYSHLDSKWFESDKELFDLIPFLERSLSMKNVKFWYDRHPGKGIEAGEKFKTKIETQIDMSDIAILLISQEFLNSTFIAEVELPRIQENYEKGNLHVFPILLEPTDWEEIEFISTLQLVPGKPTPLIEFTDNERNWIRVKSDLLKALKKKIDKISGHEMSLTSETKTKTQLNKLPKRKNKVNKAWILTASFIAILVLILLAIKYFHFPTRNTQKQDSILQVDNFGQGDIISVKIGNQIWTRDNLNTSVFNNGDPILEAKTVEEWVKAGAKKTPAWCYYNNDSANVKTYGKLYNWYAINDKRGIAPEGFHIPDKDELITLLYYLGGEGEKAYVSLIPGGTSSFNALFGGCRYYDGQFLILQSPIAYWSSSEGSVGSGSAWHLVIDVMQKSARMFYFNNNMGFSVRCLKGKSLKN